MPKMKTRKAIARRFSETATGKLKCRHDGKGHILTKKSRARKRKLRKAGYVSKQFEKNIKAVI